MNPGTPPPRKTRRLDDSGVRECEAEHAEARRELEHAADDATERLEELTKSGKLRRPTPPPPPASPQE